MSVHKQNTSHYKSNGKVLSFSWAKKTMIIKYTAGSIKRERDQKDFVPVIIERDQKSILGQVMVIMQLNPKLFIIAEDGCDLDGF